MDTFFLITLLEQEEGKWMLAVTSLEVYSSVLNLTEHSNDIKVFTPEYGEDSKTSKMPHGLIEQRR